MVEMDGKDLDAVERAFARQWDNAAIRHRALAAFSPQRYLDELRKLF